MLDILKIEYYVSKAVKTCKRENMKTGLMEGQTDHVARLGRCTGMVWYQSARHPFVKEH
jgi:hypothetical protein